MNSLENQKKYFADKILSEPDWEFVDIFYDEGVSGTSTDARRGFNRMIEECRVGHVDLILTKEVSRFARNTVDTLNYTRRLREYNVEVFFINDNIRTSDPDGELRLTIMSSLAQEESRKTSDRVKWGQREAMKNGVVFGNNSIYGFDLRGGRLSVKEDEAEVVRLIYHKYTNEGKGTHVIARELYEAGIDPPRRKKAYWSSFMLLRILRNEKYAGDLLQKKHITKNYLDHKKIINDGTEDMIFIKDHHKPIIDRFMWEKTRSELKRRAADPGTKKKYSNRYWCSGKIVCSRCSSRFTMRTTKRKWGLYRIWCCREHTMHGRSRTDSRGRTVGCSMRIINNNSLLECMRYVTGRISSGIDEIADEVAADIAAVAKSGERNAEAEADMLVKKTDELKAKKLRMLDDYYGEIISGEEMLQLKDKYDKEIAGYAKRIDDIRDREKGMDERTENTASLRDLICQRAVYSEEVYGEITDEIRVYDDYLIIKLKHLDLGFKITYSTSGYGNDYRTVIVSCEEDNI